MTAETPHTRLAPHADEAHAADPEYVRQVWARRAARLAQLPAEEEAGERVTLILIQLGQEVFGLEAAYVFDIRPLPAITPVPRAPEWVVGVVNLRGRIISVVDLKRFFRLPLVKKNAPRKAAGVAGQPALAGNGEESPQYLVVVETAEMELALLTDGVLAVRATPVSQIQTIVDAMMLTLRPDYVRGIIPHYEESLAAGRSRAATSALHVERHHDAMLVILNLPTLLADKRLVVQEELK